MCTNFLIQWCLPATLIIVLNKAKAAEKKRPETMKSGDRNTYRFVWLGMMGRDLPRYRVRRGFPLTVMAHADRAAVNTVQP